MLGTHNSLTYLPVRKWWMRLFSWVATCQDKTLEEQYEAGARCFDIRVRFDENGNAYPAHGLIEYNFPYGSMRFRLGRFVLDHKGTTLTFRMIHEVDSPADDQLFVEFCNDFSNDCKGAGCSVTLIECRRKYDWRQIAKPDAVLETEQLAGSMQSKYGKVWPRLWSIFNRAKIKKAVEEAPTEDNLTLVDFIR